MVIFYVLLISVSVLAGGVASIAGFGIGSILTPFLALKVGTGIAVAGVSVPHFLGTMMRFWKLKRYVNKNVFISFGIMSAIGGLAGALLHNVFQNAVLTAILGCLLVFAGLAGLAGISEKWKFGGITAWIAGALSGIFGGLVGNQGGIRSAAMLGFGLKGEEFVATATGIALAVDMARMPVYFFVQWRDIFSILAFVVISSLGVLIGTEMGTRVLRKIPEVLFKRAVSGIILLIGLFVLIH